MKTILFTGVSLLALAVSPALAQQQSVKIGFISTFSGPAAAIGNDMRNAFELALDHRLLIQGRDHDRHVWQVLEHAMAELAPVNRRHSRGQADQQRIADVSVGSNSNAGPQDRRSPAATQAAAS